MKKRWYVLFLWMCLISLCGCGGVSEHIEKEKPEEEIVILYTNDVHCAVDENIGYAGVAAYKEECLKETPYVTLVDCGDAIQGGVLGTLSEGDALLDLMNRVPYDLCILGNHEFDYGMEQIKYLMEKSEALYLGCNLAYNGKQENKLSSMKAYELIDYGNVTVGFIGVMTPSSIASSSLTVFEDEHGNVIYDFFGESEETDLYAVIQKNVNDCISKGADYVILLTHLGDTKNYAPYSSKDVAANTTGVDVILDGHAHHVIVSETLENKEGDEVILSSTGSRLKNIGKLTISQEREIRTELISDYEKKDTEISLAIEALKDSYADIAEKVVANSDIALSCRDENGNRRVRNREIEIGNLCADAYRYAANTDIAIINGGGIRADLPKGEITYEDILNIFPFGDSLCVVEISGQELLDVLEMSCKDVEKDASVGNGTSGESGGFLQVSGVRFSVDTSVESTVQLDKNGMFVKVAGARRVKNVYVSNEVGEYVKLDMEKKYSLASRRYLLGEAGNGYSMFLDNTYLLDEGKADTEVLIEYLTFLDGEVSKEYCEVQGRIDIE